MKVTWFNGPSYIYSCTRFFQLCSSWRLIFMLPVFSSLHLGRTPSSCRTAPRMRCCVRAHVAMCLLAAAQCHVPALFRGIPARVDYACFFARLLQVHLLFHAVPMCDSWMHFSLWRCCSCTAVLVLILLSYSSHVSTPLSHSALHANSVALLS